LSERVSEPEVKDNHVLNLFTSIWIVPLIALFISGVLVYHHFTNLGSEIRINFSSSYGLIPRESVIKFRDVPVGQITRIELQKGGDGVTVIARMNKEAEPYLNRSTRFWIVKPKVDYSGVRGLETILHGGYITMHATRKGKLKTEFTGLDEPFRSRDEGEYFHLSAKKIDNVYVGAAVYYRDIQAGSIDKIQLSPDKRSVQITIFIKKKYVELVNVTSKFWYQDLLSMNFDGTKIAFDMAPMTSILLGGISFISKLDSPYPKPDPNHVFRLYGSRSEATRQKIGGPIEHPERFRFRFSGEINGLHEGTSIRYQGFKVGEIDEVMIRYNPLSHAMEAETAGMIDTAVFETEEYNGTYNLKRAVREGLHAELKSDNPLITSLYINLVYTRDANVTSKKLSRHDGLIDFPTKRVVKNALLSRLDTLLVSLTALSEENRKPLHDLIDKLGKSAEHLNSLMAKPSFQSLTDDLNSTMGSLNDLMGESGGIDKALEALQKTLKTTKRVMRGYSSGSVFGKKLEAMLKEVGQTSEETKRLIEKLNRKPNALIFGE